MPLASTVAVSPKLKTISRFRLDNSAVRGIKATIPNFWDFEVFGDLCSLWQDLSNVLTIFISCDIIMIVIKVRKFMLLLTSEITKKYHSYALEVTTIAKSGKTLLKVTMLWSRPFISVAFKTVSRMSVDRLLGAVALSFLSQFFLVLRYKETV